jgi:hypothetical protein
MTQVRRVRRIIRKFDAWTVFKVSAVVWVVTAIALVLGLVMFWSVVTASGIPQRLTDFLIKISLLDPGSAPFANSEQFMRLAVYTAILVAVVGTAMTTLLAITYNLVSDVVGGIEVIVLEETLTAGPPPPMVQRVRAVPARDQPTEETPVIAKR